MMEAAEGQYDEPDSIQPMSSFILQSIDLKDLSIDDSAEKFHDKKSREQSANYLGGGSFGDVFKADHSVHRTVAVKIAKRGKEDLAMMYQKERGKHVQALTSSKIVSIKGSIECNDEQCKCGLIGIVMEYMERGSLWDFRKNEWKDTPDVWPLTNRMVDEITAGMQFLHSIKIIHRDLKLENVLVNSDLKVKVADLGLATNRQTSSGDECWGTDTHKPPEAFRTDIPNSQPVVTEAYDIYCFAMTLYELLTGIHPYNDRGRLMLRMLKVKEKQTPDMGPVPENTPQVLIRIMQLSWSYEPQERPRFSDIKKELAELDRNPTHQSLGPYYNECRVQESGESMSRHLEGLSLNDPVQPSIPESNEEDGPAVICGPKQGDIWSVCEPPITPEETSPTESSQHKKYGALTSQEDSKTSEGARKSENRTDIDRGAVEDPSAPSTYQPLQSSMDPDHWPEQVSNPYEESREVTPIQAEDKHHGKSECVVGHGAAGPIHQASTREVTFEDSCSSESVRDPIMVFDSSAITDEYFEIEMHVHMHVPLDKSIRGKLDEIFRRLERCKMPDYWSLSSLSQSLSLHDFTLRKLHLPPTLDDEQFTLFIYVSSESALKQLESFSKNNKLPVLLYHFFVDTTLEKMCHPVKPELKVNILVDQIKKGMEHFQKMKGAGDSKQAQTSTTESSTSQSDTNGSSIRSTQPTATGPTYIDTAKVKIIMHGTPKHLHTGDETHYHYYGKGDGGKPGANTSMSSPRGGKHPSSASSEQKEPQNVKLCESTEKVSQGLLLDVSAHVFESALPILGGRLGLNPVQVDNIIHQYRGSRSDEVVYQVLRAWLEQFGRRATKKALANSLWKAGCHDAAQLVR